jgi:hypothetical protein
MISWCRSLCKKDSKGKKDKKDKHGSKEEGKKHSKVKNVFSYTMTGQGKKNVEQDQACIFEMIEESTLVRFFGIFDGHGDFGREVSNLYPKACFKIKLI